MNRLKKLLFSITTSLMLMAIMAVSIGVATILEKELGTEYAQQVIYQARWFECLMLLLVVNFIGSMFIHKLTDRKKTWINLFHKGFLFVILGASITRYTGYEGVMHLREGEESNIFFSNNSILKIILTIQNKKEILDFDISSLQKNSKKITKNLLLNNENINIQINGGDSMKLAIGYKNQTRHLYLFKTMSDLSPTSCTLENLNITTNFTKKQYKLPFYITLQDFKLERYAGSNSPSSYTSEVTIMDKRENKTFPYSIYMNHILNYKGYRFFQASYDPDEKGTILMVNHDYYGTMISYFGYILLLIGMTLTLFNKNSRFQTVMRLRRELKNKRMIAVIGFLALFLNTSHATEIRITKEEHFTSLSKLLVQDVNQGRIEPFGTFASDVLRKIYKKTHYNDIPAEEVIISMMTNPSRWIQEPIIKVSNSELANELGAIDERVSIAQLFNFKKNNAYLLEQKVNQIYQKEQSNRTKYENEVINLDERVNICYLIFSGEIFRIFPSSESKNWNSYNLKILQENFDSKSITNSFSYPEKLLVNYLESIKNGYSSGNWESSEFHLKKIKEYQAKQATNTLPSEIKIWIELQYNSINIFGVLSYLYLIVSLIVFIIYFILVFQPQFTKNKGITYLSYPFYILFALYSTGIITRWYISGHAPWSNGYESMVFVGWATSLSGIIFSKNSIISLSTTGLVTFIALLTASMNWMNPEITNLVPVLKSNWLLIHVAVITSSYGFLGMGAVLGLFNLILMIIRQRRPLPLIDDNIQEIGYLIEMALTIGLFLLTIGCFLGGVWANESWGRYWGWDAKETWTLIGILVYSIVLHLRLIPKLNTRFTKSSMAVLAILVILMTYLGVNYYLTGMHSYGKGISPSISILLYFLLSVIFIIIIMAYMAEKNSKSKIESDK